MRTTLDIDGELLAEAMKASGAATKTEAVRRGLESLIAAAARRRLIALYGRIPEAEGPPRRFPGAAESA